MINPSQTTFQYQQPYPISLPPNLRLSLPQYSFCPQPYYNQLPRFLPNLDLQISNNYAYAQQLRALAAAQAYNYGLPTSLMNCYQELPVKEEDSFIYKHKVVSPFKLEENDYKVETSPIKPVLKEVKPKKSSSSSHGGGLQSQVSQILKFLLDKFGKVSTEEIEQEKRKYSQNPKLLELFAYLVEKFNKSGKCREDMVRYVMRKAFAYKRDLLRNKSTMTAKAASLALCKKYFQKETQEIIKKGSKEEETELLRLMLPYKKDARNKTVNLNYISEIFSSEAFQRDYDDYLANFDQIMKAENQKKTNKLVSFLVACVENNDFDKIHDYKRLPWLKAWIESSKVIARELSNLHGAQKEPVPGSKKTKGDNTKWIWTAIFFNFYFSNRYLSSTSL